MSIIIRSIFLKKKVIFVSYQSRSVVRLSVRACECASFGPSVAFLVDLSPPKPLDVATSNFVPY